MGHFGVGDKVEVLDEKLKGTVTHVSHTEITLETEDGFIMKFMPSELIRTSGAESLKVTNYEVAQIKSEKEFERKKRPAQVKPKERNAPKMEVDLHINQLTKSSKGLSNHDILNIQLETAKRQLEFAIRKRIQKVVFIHGVGEGVLKEELKYLFGRYERLTYYDADYQKYGMGATEVYIYLNP